MALKSTPIADEGRLLITLVMTAALLCLMFLHPLYSLPLWLMGSFLLFLYRDPARKVPASPLGIVAAADGTVVRIEVLRDELLERDAVCISIKLNLLGPYIIRSPIEGKVLRQWKRVGDCHYAQWVQTDEQDDVLMALRAGIVKLPLSCRVAAGERIGQGARCGVLLFGRMLDLYLPVNSLVSVKKGDKVKAGEDILATLVHIKQ